MPSYKGSPKAHKRSGSKSKKSTSMMMSEGQMKKQMNSPMKKNRMMSQFKVSH